MKPFFHPGMVTDTSNRDWIIFVYGAPSWPGNPPCQFFLASAQVKAHVAIGVKFTWLIMFTDCRALPISVVGPAPGRG